MNAGPNHEYHWTDSQKRSLKIHAVQYIDFVFSWVQNMLADENIFPTRSGYAFPKDFGMTVRMIFKQLFRVLAHIYHSHYDIILNLSEESHLNTLFAHFVCFAKVFDLLEKKEFIPMQELIESLEAAGRI
ncbi:MOB kinase activator 1B [Globomyces sp. JEL0801]|nr:MOB kinase activator 1B [Globomyces sp. JEL0801]